MRKQLMCALALLALASTAMMQARTILGTPLPLYQGYPAGHVYFPLDRNEPIDNCLNMDIDIWGAGYFRQADDAYGPQAATDCNGCDADGKSEKVPLTQLIFGQDNFTIAQAFAGASVGTAVPNNPWVTVSTLSPRFDYSEQGVFFGLILGTRFGCDDQWRAGVRFALPYRDITVGQDATCSDLIGETLDDVFRQRQETIATTEAGDVTNGVWAARLDFLSALKQIVLNANNTPGPDLVLYNQTGNQIKIGSQVINGDLVNDTSPIIAAIRSTDGSIPATARWGNTPQSAVGTFADSGTGLADLQRGNFANGTGYAGLGADTSQQRQLWIVPNISGDTGTLIGGAQTVFTEISQSLSDVQPDVTDFLQEHGINFCNGRSKGIGDLDMEWYLAFQRCDYSFVELQFGVRCPTGKKITDPLNLVKQPLGNNGHFELRPGIVLGCAYWDWVKFKADLTYSIVLKKKELVGSPFAGATVRNLGPAIPADVSWSYFWGDIDLTFVHPGNECFGATVAYQPYVKLADKVDFGCCSKAPDFLGVRQALDATLLEKDTKRVAHTIRTEVFFDTSCCKIYGGFAQVIAGYNVTRDFDMYLGLTASF